MKNWSNLAKIVYKRTYARETNGKLESWPDTIDRVLQGNFHNVPDTEEYRKEREELRQFMLERKGGPAGRGFWFSGTEAHKRLGGVALQNCWAITAENWENLIIAMDLLMLGGGVGLSIEHRFTSKLPKIKKGVKIVHKNTKDADFIVPDSREGWLELARRVYESFFQTGKSFSFSTICVRGYGEKIEGFGGTSSGPKPLIQFIENISQILTKREGKFPRPIDMLDCMCATGEVVVSGNVRRSAIIIMGDAFDKDYLKCKRWDLGSIPSYRAFANMSIIAEDAENDLTPLFWKTYEHGEPFGIVNRKNIQTYGRMGELKHDSAELVNPCLHGDTLVALADGRMHKTIKQLAEEGKDIPVYCLSEEGAIEIRMMRSPRITGYNIPMLEVVLDNGQSIKVTENHKFLLNDLGYVEAKDLKPGNSLRILARRKNKLGKSLSDYWCFFDRKKSKDIFEHCLIAQFHHNIEDRSGILIHHENGNSLDNSKENLKIMTRGEHSTIHSDSVGEKNPKYSGYTNEQIKEAILTLTKQIGRRVSHNEWIKYAKEHGYPTKFTRWRMNHLNDVNGLLKLCAIECGFDHVDLDPRTTRHFLSRLNEGYDAFIQDGEVWLNKHCEKCEKHIVTKTKGTKYCSMLCMNLARAKEIRAAARLTLLETVSKTQNIVREKQIKVYLDLQSQYLRKPSKGEWVKECKRLGISGEISRISSPFRNFKALVQAAQSFNHRVIEVKPAGVGTVYNGTVDDFSNFFVGGFEENGKLIYLNNLNCAEATLENKESCNIQDLALPNISDENEFERLAVLLHRYGKRVTLEKFHIPTAEEVKNRNRRIGTGITGCLERPDLFNPNVLDRVYAAIQKENTEYSKELNIPESIRTTLVKPSGTFSKMFDCRGEGLHAGFSRYIIQRVRFAANDKLIPLLRAAGHHVEPVIRFDGSLDHSTLVVDFYLESPKELPCADEDFDTWKQLDTLLLAQRHWADQAVSVTVYYKKEELSQVKAWLSQNLQYIKSISFLCHSDHGFKQAPKEAITKEQYEKLSTKIVALDEELIYTGSIESLECAGGVCPIK